MNYMNLNYRELANKIPLDARAYALRNLVLNALEGGERGHFGPALSLLEIVRVLYDSVLVHDSSNPKLAQRDRFILSKGHGCLGLYAVLSDHGYFPKEDLKGFCCFESALGGHPERDRLPGIEFSTGSLGHGLSVAIGISMAARLRNEKWRTFVLLGDGELNEGSIWEGAMHASKHQLGMLTLVIDLNGMQASGMTDYVVSVSPLADKWAAFGFDVFECNGHDIVEIEKILNGPTSYISKPKVILAHTIKGKGFKSAENSDFWHHRAKISKHEIDALRNEIPTT
jgi:transketolase